MKKLNLGCGQFPKPGYVNVDFDPASGAEVLHDLTKAPYPFADGEFEHIEADHVLEHLPDTMAVMREMVRMLRPGGTIDIRVPHFSRGFTHWDHKRGFDVGFPLYFQPDFKGGYSGIELELVNMRLTWFAQPWLKREVFSLPVYLIGRSLGIIFDFFANLSPYAASRLFCFWVGGFEELSIRFRKPLNSAPANSSGSAQAGRHRP